MLYDAGRLSQLGGLLQGRACIHVGPESLLRKCRRTTGTRTGRHQNADSFTVRVTAADDRSESQYAYGPAPARDDSN